MPGSARLPLRSAPPRRLVVNGNLKCHWHALAAAARTSDTGALADGHGAGGLGGGSDSDGGRGRWSLRRGPGCARRQHPISRSLRRGDGRRIEQEQGQPGQGEALGSGGGRCCVALRLRGAASGRSLAASGGARNAHAALDGDPRPAIHPPRPSCESCAAPPARGPSVVPAAGCQCTSCQWAGLPVRFRRSLSRRSWRPFSHDAPHPSASRLLAARAGWRRGGVT